MIFDIAPGETALALDLPTAYKVDLWRPNGLGARAFYEVSVDTNSITTSRVAFRNRRRGHGRTTRIQTT